MSIIINEGPISLPKAKWDNIDFFIPDQFKRDFCHDHLLTFKLKCTSRQYTSLQFIRKLTSTSYYDKIKMWRELNKVDTYLYVHYINQKIKIHYDNGLRYHLWTPYNCYGSLDFRRDGKESKIKIGVNYLGDIFNIDNRLKLGPKYNAILYTRVLGYLPQIQVGAQSVINLRTQQFLKKDAFLWYSVCNFRFQFKCLQDWDQPTGFSNLSRIFTRTFTTILYKKQLDLYGLQIQVWRKNNKLNKLISLVFDHKIDSNSRFKIKLNDSYICTVLYEKCPTKQLKVSVGSQVTLGTTSKFKIGCKLTINM